MRYSRSFIFTRKEIPADIAGISGILLSRAGMVQRQAGGIYSYLPPALRIIRSIERIIREELETAGALELSLPLLQPASSRAGADRQANSPGIFCLDDHRGTAWCHVTSDEEAVTALAGSFIRSYRNLPVMLYQAATRFTGVALPGTGPAYSREFKAIDIYFLAIDQASAAESYNKIITVLENSFQRCGLETNSPGIEYALTGKNRALEYFAITGSSGEPLFVCPGCGAAFSTESAECRKPAAQQPETTNNTQLESPQTALPAMESISTPGKRTVEEVTRFLGLKSEQLVKTLIFQADGQVVVVLVRGDCEISPVKLQAVLGCSRLIPAGEDVIREVTGAPVGFAGPVGLKQPVPLYADYSVLTVSQAIVGANAPDLHLKNVVPGRDLPGGVFYHDLRMACEGEPCALCTGGSYRKQLGIKTAQIRLPGLLYSERGKAFVLDNKGNKQLPWLGCCRINCSALLAAVVEQHHDEQGIIWPAETAPFRVIICPVGSDPQVLEAAEVLYRECIKAQVNVLLDDRAEQAGVMFKDADLLGIPIRITIGVKRLAEGMMELKRRGQKEAAVIPRERILESIINPAEKNPGQELK